MKLAADPWFCGRGRGESPVVDGNKIGRTHPQQMRAGEQTACVHRYPDGSLLLRDGREVGEKCPVGTDVGFGAIIERDRDFATVVELCIGTQRSSCLVDPFEPIECSRYLDTRTASKCLASDVCR